jgi:hypothetical protein
MRRRIEVVTAGPPDRGGESMYQFARDGSQRSGGHVRAVLALIAALTAGLVPLAMANAAGAAPHGLHTVIRGLDNPRGLAFLSDGQLVVAEGGHGGSLCLAPGQCGGLTGRVIAVNLTSGRRTTLGPADQ